MHADHPRTFLRICMRYTSQSDLVMPIKRCLLYTKVIVWWFVEASSFEPPPHRVSDLRNQYGTGEIFFRNTKRSPFQD
jgi:hypothetical protein